MKINILVDLIKLGSLHLSEAIVNEETEINHYIIYYYNSIFEWKQT